MSLNDKLCYDMAILVAGIFLAFGGHGWLRLMGVALAVLAFVLKRKWLRCPHCGAGLLYYMKHCSACGEAIDWKKKP